MIRAALFLVALAACEQTTFTSTRCEYCVEYRDSLTHELDSTRLRGCEDATFEGQQCPLYVR